jgi:hypothetical protein
VRQKPFLKNEAAGPAEVAATRHKPRDAQPRAISVMRLAPGNATRLDNRKPSVSETCFRCPVKGWSILTGGDKYAVVMNRPDFFRRAYRAEVLIQLLPAANMADFTYKSLPLFSGT